MTFLLPATATIASEIETAPSLGDDLYAIRWETAGVFLGITAIGAYSWDWGSSTSFKYNPEGWFGKNTGSGGMDKLGHAFSSYAMTNGLSEALLAKGRDPQRAATAALIASQALMFYVEIFDGYSNDHGFAREDLVFNFSGSVLAWARTVYPRVRDLVDYRLEYTPSGYSGFRPLSDYAG